MIAESVAKTLQIETLSVFRKNTLYASILQRNTTSSVIHISEPKALSARRRRSLVDAGGKNVRFVPVATTRLSMAFSHDISRVSG